jgi:hypothetical protein
MQASSVIQVPAINTESRMSTQRSPASPPGFPPRQPAKLQTVQSGLDLLRDWRGVSVATAIVMGALLPFAVAWHVRYEIMIAACAVCAVTLALGCHVARECRLAALVIFPELERLPDLAGKRRHLASTRSRQALAGGLRRAADPNQPPSRFDCCPVLRNRVSVVRTEMLDLACALDQASAPDPTSVALIRELLTNGCSPLYNPNLSTDELRATLTDPRAGMDRPPL